MNYRSNSAKLETVLYGYLGGHLKFYISLYRQIARDMGIGEESLPDFLELASSPATATDVARLPGEPAIEKIPAMLKGKGNREEKEPAGLLIGQEELPYSTTELLAGEDMARDLAFIQNSFELDDRLTEKVVGQKIRLAQHRFAREVLGNYGYSCVFCGFTPPPALPKVGSGLLRASHIKPWSASNNRER